VEKGREREREKERERERLKKEASKKGLREGGGRETTLYLSTESTSQSMASKKARTRDHIFANLHADA